MFWASWSHWLTARCEPVALQWGDADLLAIKWSQKPSLLSSVDDTWHYLWSGQQIFEAWPASQFMYCVQMKHGKKHLHIKYPCKISSSSSHAPLRQIVCGSCWFKIKTRCSALASPWWIFSPNSHTATLVTITRSCKSQAHKLLFCEITRESTPVSYRLRFSCILFILCPCNLCFTMQSF